MNVNIRRRSKQLTALLILLCLVFLSLYSCGSANSQGKQELRVVTEESTWDRMNGQLYVLEKAYEKANANVDIKVEYLPVNEQERDVYLQKLRTEILQGGGPDCYLLPTDNTVILDEPAQYVYTDVKPLFPDVDIAMRNRLFYDISNLYDSDNELVKEELNAMIMDSGVVDGKRYILPLRYDIPVIYAQNHVLEAAGLDPDILSQDIVTIMEAVYETGDPILAGGILYSDLSAFSGFIDYESCNSTLGAEALSQYMINYQKLKSLLGDEYFDFDVKRGDSLSNPQISQDTVLAEKLNLKKFIYYDYEQQGKDNFTVYYPLWIGSMQDALEYIPLSQYEKSDLTIQPLRTADGGDVIATVTYYGAVGSGCKNPELAYDFLRQFLLKDSQLEANRPARNHTKPWKGLGSNISNDLQYPGLIAEGWPVRDKDSFQKLWLVRKKQLYVILEYSFMDPDPMTKAKKARMNKIGSMITIEKDRIAALSFSIDGVRFNTTLSDEFADVLYQLNDPGRGNAPLEADIEKLAEQFVYKLHLHVSEGR